MQAICQLQRLARAAEKLWDGLILHAVIAMGALVQKKWPTDADELYLPGACQIEIAT